MEKKTLIIFDMDGTILNTLEDLADSVNHALENNGFPKRTLEEIRGFVGNGIRRLIERALPEGCRPEAAEHVLDEFTGYYREHCADKTRPYDGVKELLDALRKKGYRTAVVSNKADFGVQKLCGIYFPGLFDYAVGEKPGIRKKPCPDSVFHVLEEMHTAGEAAVYIGDSEIDIETAKNAGIDMIAVEWGFRDKAFLIKKGAGCTVDSPGQILRLL